MNWLTFFGRFHPLLVHLPIGILILACLFDWLSLKEKFKSLKEALRISLLLGAIAALASCITGYSLSLSGEYDANTVAVHQWLGISTMIFSFVYWQMKKIGSSERISKIFSVTILILLSFTGHFGGTLTHGENYLTEIFTNENTQVDFSSLDLNSAFYYQDIVQPILNARCYSCHGESKQKGKLRLDQQEFILRGGKNGKTIVANHPDESEMINRLLLPLDEKKHMPPKEKPQPSSVEIELLKNWISLGADFTKSVKSLNGVDAVHKILLEKKSVADELDIEVAQADDKVLSQLRKYNVAIVALAKNNNHLTANLVNVQSIDSVVSLLPSLKDQLVWLSASSNKISDEHLKRISKVSALRKLDISHSSISKSGIDEIKSLTNLAVLNLSYTSTDFETAKTIAALPKLKELFLFNTQVSENEIQMLKKDFPAIHFEFGKYSVPILQSDTALVKPPKK